ncbi:hypothetical protein ACI63T_001567 [Neisseria gonorrhoeae]|uniref:hypothetical protein n=1 Tax=Neisseria gonorrhoeae TaxID=485 RepID=UPI001F3DE64E|nr:hypothetical protein [Neisseria gonorrhoeae]MCF3061035.1 hypothetical protein [Neisseria gonorrhoeae]MCU9855593.1 hypothetical protein [Neisseria gonorrhoeae]MDO6010162.1 hypothetical protein [Neisseria gonorrhoeae]UWT32790.1 hypothetical protein NDQ70_06820 [Neisseria gonorrhoeae]
MKTWNTKYSINARQKSGRRSNGVFRRTRADGNTGICNRPEKGGIRKSGFGRVILIKSGHIVIHNADGDSFATGYGVIAADIVSPDLKTDFDIFFPPESLLRYKKIGKKK